MGKPNWSVAFLVCFACAITGCGKHDNSRELAVVVQADPTTKTALEKLLRDHPKIVVPDKKIEYSIIVVKPDPNVDYRILKVVPDPNINYKILIVDPRSQQPVTGPVGQLGDALREELEGKLRVAPMGFLDSPSK